MTYSTSSPPRMIVPGGMTENVPNIWGYSSTDTAATVAGSNYFSNGSALGMKVGDIVIVDDSATPLTTTHRVNTVTAGGAADVGTGTTIGIATG